jgi:hypothetical protein
VANDRLLDSLKPAEIKAAVLAEMNERGSAESYELTVAVARRCGSNERNYPPDARAWAIRDIDDRYVGRIKRGLESLTDDGILVKHGSGYKKIPKYWTQAAWAERERQALEAAAAEEAERQRWVKIADRLSVQGLLFSGMPHSSPGRLSRDDWEKLLDKAGW